MKLEDFKHLEDWNEDKPIRVLFTFKCSKCKKRFGVYKNGDQYITKHDFCPKCNNAIKTTYKEKDEVSTTSRKCTSCKCKDIEVNDWKKGR